MFTPQDLQSTRNMYEHFLVHARENPEILATAMVWMGRSIDGLMNLKPNRKQIKMDDENYLVFEKIMDGELTFEDIEAVLKKKLEAQRIEEENK